MTDDRPYIEIQFTGRELTQVLSSDMFYGTDIVIDYGDGTIINYTGNYSHTYSTSGTYTIRIYGVTLLLSSCFSGCSGFTSIVFPEGVTDLGDGCFNECYGLTSVVIPDSMESIGEYCFDSSFNLTDMQFNWTSSNDILAYDSDWFPSNSSVVFSIPYGTTSLYSAKDYPIEKLVERSPPASSHELFNDVKTLFLNNKEVKSIVINEPNGGIIYEKTITLITTSLTIEVPALVYSDVFDVTGLLTDDNNNPINGASVKLYRDGSILEATETTDSNGEVTFHRSAPTSITTYTFQLVFDGDSNYNNSSSSVVTRKVNAETTILNLTSPLNNATYYEGETIPIAGTITTDDGEQLSSENLLIVTAYDENNNQLKSLPIGNGGAFSGNITAPSSAGNHSITVKFRGAAAHLPPDEEPQVPSTPDEEPSSVPSVPETEEPPEPQLIYAPSEAIRNYTITPVSLTLTSNKNILSAYNEETATLTATLNASDNANKTVTFKKGNTILGTDVTDSNGEATYTYESSGIGDVVITAECNGINTTYNIEDCEFISSTEYHITGAQNVRIEPDFIFQNGDWELTSNFRGAHNGEQFGVADAISSSSSSLKCFASSVKQGNNYYLTGLQGLTDTSQEVWIRSSSYMNTSTYYPMKIRKEGATLYYYFNGNLMDTVTSNEFASVEYLSLFIRTYYSDDSQGIYVKDIKLKRINSLTLNSNRNTLSYLHNESATLTATLTNNNIGISGETITFKKGSTVLDTVITDSNGEAEYEYISQGVGDVTITATYGLKQATYNISDYPAIYIDNCDGTQKEIFTTTAEGGTYKTFSYTTYGGYQCLNHNTNFGWYPSSSSGNMLIEYDMYPRGSWGGTSIKGANGTRLVWYMQGSQYNDMSYQIAVKVPSQWNKCKILIQDGVVTAWLNDNQIGQITTTVTHPLYDEMGSGTNPCYIKNLKIIELP